MRKRGLKDTVCDLAQVIQFGSDSLTLLTPSLGDQLEKHRVREAEGEAAIISAKNAKGPRNGEEEEISRVSHSSCVL